MYEASGQWSTTHSLNPQPSLTDGRGEGEGGGEEGRRGGLHTNHSQINSLLPQSTILPPFSLLHLSLFFLLPAHSLTSPCFLSSSQFFISCLCFFFIHPPPVPLYPPTCYMASPNSFSCLQPGDPVRRKMIPGGTRGVGGRLCPWSRCLTWAKPAKIPPCQGSSPGCKLGQRGQTGGTGDGRTGAVHGGSVPSKTNHQLHFFTHNIVCLSVLPLSPGVRLHSPTKYTEVFLSSPSHLPFLTLFFLIACIHKHTIYTPLAYPPASLSLALLAVSHSHHKPLPSLPALIFSGR